MYLFLKLLHIISVVLFLGNITTGIFWHSHAARTRDPKFLADAMDGIIRSDRFFTIPGVIGIIVTGFALATLGNLIILRTGWILWTLGLFGISGVVFMAFVAPLQRQLLAFADAAVIAGRFDYDRYRSLAIRWEIWGTLSLLTPLAGLVLMVLKPAF